jgi:hypothetical protein
VDLIKSNAKRKRGDLHTRITVQAGNTLSHVYALGRITDPEQLQKQAKKSGLRNPEIKRVREVYLRENHPLHPKQTGRLAILGAHGREGGHGGHGEGV